MIHIIGPSRYRPCLAGFTLAELLVAMAIIAILATLTAVSVKKIAGDARLSSAVNGVSAALDNARALAMKNNQIVMVVFRPRLKDGEQRVEAVTAKWTGASLVNKSGSYYAVADYFTPIPDVPVRELSPGIKVAAPQYMYASSGGEYYDYVWTTQPRLTADLKSPPYKGDSRGEMIAVMYAAHGTTISRNPQKY